MIMNINSFESDIRCDYFYSETNKMVIVKIILCIYGETVSLIYQFRAEIAEIWSDFQLRCM